MPLVLANNFLAGSLLSFLLPILMLIALVVWYLVAVRRVPTDGPQPPDPAPTEPPPPALGGPPAGQP